MMLRLRFVVALLLFAIGSRAEAVEPSIKQLNVRGLAIDGATRLIIDGDGLADSPRLLLPFAIKQQLASKASAGQATFDVVVPADVSPGYYQLRVVTDHGVSLPTPIAVDRLPQRPASTSVEQLPFAVHGSVGPGQTVEVKFAGKSGRKIVVDIESQRIGSKLRPVVHLYGPDRLQLAWAWPAESRQGDCRMQATLPREGVYIVSVHDQEYSASGLFRLKVGEFSTVDQIIPPAVAAGQTQPVELRGDDSWNANVAAPSSARFAMIDWPKGPLFSGFRPFVTVSQHPELFEATGGATGQQLPAGDVAVTGRLSKPKEVDVYKVSVTPGSSLRFDVFAERMGSPIDASLTIKNPANAVLIRGEDSPGTLDPSIKVAVPPKTDFLTVEVADTQGRGGPHAAYRLRILSDRDNDFSLFTPTQRLSLPPGGRGVLPVHIDRNGYRGEVRVSGRLPVGFTAGEAVIPADADGVLALITRDAAAKSEAIISEWKGQALKHAQQPVVVPGNPLQAAQPWLAHEIAMAPIDAKVPPFQVDWRDFPADASLRPGATLDLPVKLTHDDEKAAVRLSLITSQSPRKGADAAKALKLEKAAELKPKQMEATASLIVPPTIAGPVYDVAILAELLAADKKTVLAQSVTPVRRLEVRSPLVVKLDGPPRREARADAKDRVLTLAGTIERRDKFQGEVAVTISGLPKEFKAPTATLKGEEAKFSLPISIPPGVTAGVIPLELSASASIDPKQPNVKVRSRDVDIVLVITSGTP